MSREGLISMAGGFDSYSQVPAGPLLAGSKVRAAVFSLQRVPTGRDGVTSASRPSFLRHLSARAPSPVTPFPASYPHAVKTIPASAWRTRIGKFLSGTFFPESEAQRLTIAPRLPHHRHPMTPDEALAGIVLFLTFVGAVIYLAARFL